MFSCGIVAPQDNAMASAMEAVDRGEDLDDRELTIRCLSVHLARVSSIRNQNILEFLKMTPAAAHQVTCVQAGLCA